MKKIIILFSLLLIICNEGFSQRHIKGLKGAYLSGGISKLGYFGKIGGSYNLGRRLYANADVMIENGEVLNFKFQTYNLTGMLHYIPFNIKDKIYFSLALGPTINLSQVRKVKLSDTGSEKDLNQFDYGLVAGIEVETFISDKFIWLLDTQQRWFISNKFGSLAWYTGTGIKYIF